MNYFKLNAKSELRELLLDLAKTSTLWKNEHSIDILDLTKHSIDYDSTINYFLKTFEAKPILLRLPPNTFYRFHIDATRKCAINMLLEGNDSHCYFGKITEHEEVINNITELKYDENCYYLFNTLEKHAILNLNNYRYLLSVGIEKHNFFTVLEKYKEQFQI